MAWKNSNRLSLSKSILEMKFMKRTKEKVEKQSYQEEGEDYFGNELTNRMKKQSGQFIVEPSYILCENLIEGRLSFQGENPEIERIMELEYMEKVQKAEENKDKDVSDIEMAQRWKSTTKINIRNISSMKDEIQSPSEEEQPKRKRPKFLKPPDQF